MSQKRENALLRYFKDSWSELKLVSWPTKEVAIKSTILVVAFCFLMAVYTGVLDATFNAGYQLLLDLAKK